jgi:hypothetical protein
VLVKEALKADEKTGTEAFGVGEELVTAAPLKGVGEGKGGKPIPVFRVRKGTPASISDGGIVLLDLAVETSAAETAAPANVTPPVVNDAELWEKDSPIRLRIAQLRTRNALLEEQLQRLRPPLQVRGKKK